MTIDGWWDGLTVWTDRFFWCPVCARWMWPGTVAYVWLFPPYLKFTAKHDWCIGPVQEISA